MSDFYDDLLDQGSGFLAGLHPSLRAAIFVAIPFTIVDFFNYYSAGTALVLSLPLQIILYGGVGALAAKFASDAGRESSPLPFTGALAGLALWLFSTVVNTVISLIIGASTLGATLILGIPYLCFCAPFQMVGGGLMGALGG